MCTNKEEQSKTTRKGDVNVKINKQHVKYNSSNHDTNDNPSVDFRIHTNIEFITDKKMKICLLINILISIVCITISFIACYKLYNLVIQMQNEMTELNQRIETLLKRCEQKYEEIETHHAQAQFSSLDKGFEMDLDVENKSKDGALVAHFKGSVPEIFVKDQGLIGPWYLDNSVSRQYKFPKFHLTEGQCSIEVTEPALYLIYAQVYYVTMSAVNSYSLIVRSEGSSENNIIAKCSAVGPKSHSAELSCYTATVHSLKANDRIFIQQTEKNRTIILRDGHSFFGLVRLNNSQRNHKK